MSATLPPEPDVDRYCRDSAEVRERTVESGYAYGGDWAIDLRAANRFAPADLAEWNEAIIALLQEIGPPPAGQELDLSIGVFPGEDLTGLVQAVGRHQELCGGELGAFFGVASPAPVTIPAPPPPSSVDPLVPTVLHLSSRGVTPDLPFGSDPDTVIAAFEADLGVADADTGWQSGGYCDTERIVRWGGLSLVFAKQPLAGEEGFNGFILDGHAPVGVDTPAQPGESLAAIRDEYGERVGPIRDLRADYFGILAVLEPVDPIPGQVEGLVMWLHESDLDTITTVKGGYACSDS
ncbi:MAG: hypothetical protein R2707_10180 [Acidimicrobiales bacterium]